MSGQATPTVTGRGRFLRRVVILGFGSVVSMALGFAALSDAVDLFGGADGATAETAVAESNSPDAPATGTGDTPPADETDDLVSEEGIEDPSSSLAGQGVYHRRDPFSPVVAAETEVTNAGSAELAAAPPIDPTASPQTSPETQPTDPTQAPVAGTPAAGPTVDPDPTSATPVVGCLPDGDTYVCDGIYVALGNVGTDATGVMRAVVQLDTTVYEAEAGVMLPGGFEVVSVSASCVDLRYAGQTIQLCESGRVLK